jgi:SAM-dependent methyltransferase
MHESDYDQSPDLAEFYDHVIPYRNRPDVPFYVAAALDAGGPVLELGCGTGRTLIPIARAGGTITGIDSSRWMLERCRERMAGEPEGVRARVDLHPGDMRDFDLGRRFRLITVPFRAFQHLMTVEDQVHCLEAILRALEPGGRLILDLFNPSLARLAVDPAADHFDPEPPFTMPDGRVVVRHIRVLSRDVFAQVQEAEFRYEVRHPDGRSEDVFHRFGMRYLFRYEVEHLLHRCGFEVDALYADYEKRPFGSQNPGDLIFVAKRRGDA